MRAQEAYKLALELHQQGFSVARIHRDFMPSINVNRMYSWLGPSKSKPYLEPDLTPTPTLAYFLGVLYGDCTIGRYPQSHGQGFYYVFHLAAIDREFINCFKLAIEKIGLRSSRVSIKRQNQKNHDYNDLFSVTTFSKSLYKWFKGLTFDQVYELLQTVEMKREFIRGFYESEGCLSLSNDKRKKNQLWRIAICNTNFELIKLVRQILNDLGFFFFTQERKMKPPKRQIYYLRLNKQEAIKSFLAEINPCIPRKSLTRLENNTYSVVHK